MKITKFTHSCLLVEMPEPTNRTVLFDPGSFSTIDLDKLAYLDDIVVTHMHGDHMDPELIKQLQAKFPKVRVVAPPDAKEVLEKAGVRQVTTEAPDGMRFFSAPHASVEALGWPVPDEIGVHYLDMLTHPGDSHTFTETMPVLALPVTAPWGSTVRAAEIALQLKPKYVIPIHDWHWRDEARQGMYEALEQRFKQAGITFIKPVDGEAFVIHREDLA